MTDSRDRPLITFALFSFNQERYIREAVEGALSQTYEPLQIILSDDCSTDSTFAEMSSVVSSYSGPHDISLIRNEANVGVCAHVNSVINKARGALIVLAGGDDISCMTRVEKVAAVWKETGASAVYSESKIIDEESAIIGDWSLPRVSSNVVIRDVLSRFDFYGAAAAYDKGVFECFGPLPTDIRNEDYNLAFRSALMSGLAYINEPLVQYRQHSQNLSFWVKMKHVKGIRETWALKSEIYGNTARNQRHVLGYIRAKSGASCRLYREYKTLMLWTVLRHRVYRKLGNADSGPIIVRSGHFDVTDYFRLIPYLIAKAPALVWRKYLRPAR